jgi:hypothetical protein
VHKNIILHLVHIPNVLEGLRSWFYLYLQASAIAELHSSPLHMHYGSQSSLVVSWQRVYNSLTVTSNHTQSFLSCHYSV